jgi:hypothetical protein
MRHEHAIRVYNGAISDYSDEEQDDEQFHKSEVGGLRLTST